MKKTPTETTVAAPTAKMWKDYCRAVEGKAAAMVLPHNLRGPLVAHAYQLQNLANTLLAWAKALEENGGRWA